CTCEKINKPPPALGITGLAEVLRSSGTCSGAPEHVPDNSQNLKPYPFFEFLIDPCDREADDGVVVSVYAADVDGECALDSVCAGFIVWFAGGEIGINFSVCHWIDVHIAFFKEGICLCVCTVMEDKADAGVDLMGMILQRLDHVSCFFFAGWFSENLSVV